MSMFSSKQVIKVTEGDNSMFILPKMSFGVRQKVLGLATKLSPGNGDANFDIGAYNTALMVHNVKGWEGPEFEGVQCTAEAIMDLDPEQDLVVKVLEKLQEQNLQTKKDDKNDPNTSKLAGVSDSTASIPDQSESTRPTSPSQNGSTGPLTLLTT